LDELREEDWQDFITGLVPPGLSQLFFFDGEKIQKIIEDNNNAEFKSSVKMLLGLDLIERLQADLKIYKSRNLKDLSSGTFNKELESLNKEKTSVEEARKKKRDKLAVIENQVLKIENEISTYREKIRVQGHDYLKREDSLNQEKLTLEKDLEILKDRLREIAAGPLPLVIAADWSRLLNEQIKKEQAQHSDRIASEKLKEKKGILLENLNSHEIFQSFESQLKERVNKAVETEIDTLFEFESRKTVTEIFRYSTSQAQRLLITIESALNEVPQNLKELSGKHEDAFKKLRETVAQLEKVPDEDLIKPMYEKLNQLNLELGAVQNEKKHLEEEVAALERHIEELDREIGRINKKIEANQKETVKLDLAKKAEKVLSIYKRELALQKIEVFKKEFLSIFRELHRKKDVVRQIEIDPASFDITLYDGKQAVIKTESLSAGEKEIYAIALLTALARSSGQNLPFIIDTPLGRLDTVHRDRIVQRFFPSASHQMLIFSTNTEIDKKYFEVLKPNISRSYNLVYDQDSKRTRVEEGYFWI
jgi:DNA sulfur modification protein DndD